jgi:peptide chain release factor 1
MATYTITLSDAEDKALHVVALSAQDWIDNAVHERCRIAIDEIVNAEVQRLLAAGQPITGSKDDIVMAADVESAAERQVRLEAEAQRGARSVRYRQYRCGARRACQGGRDGEKPCRWHADSGRAGGTGGMAERKNHTMSMDKKLDGLIARHGELRELISNPDKLKGGEYAKCSKEYSDLTPIVETALALKAAQAELEDIKALMKDPDMKALAEEEKIQLEKLIPKLTADLQVALLPKDEADEKNAILEVRAGTGGDEAALFAADLFRMYQRFCEAQGWKFEVISISETGLRGYKEASASISGKNVFQKLKFESGVHRVQRVPATETQGRIHTSAATVAVLPEAEEVDIQINENDLRIDVFRSSGPGGQSVNTTDSAVRIVHIPTGITVQQQDEKSQHKNKAKALKVLRARLYDMEYQKREQARASARKGQIGSGDRSERIRTYNFPQGRVTDHRINMTSYNLDEVMEGSGLLSFCDALIAEDQAEKLATLKEG